MSEIIIGQVRFLLMTSLLGMALIGAYDICRFVRWLIPHHKLVTALGDILFWIVMSVPAYGLFFIFNDGEIRWYGVLAVFLGSLLYEKGISFPLRKWGNRYLSVPRKKIIGFIGGGLKRVLRLLKKVHKKLKNKLHKNEK